MSPHQSFNALLQAAAILDVMADSNAKMTPEKMREVSELIKRGHDSLRSAVKTAFDALNG